MLKRLIKTKTFWTGLAAILTGTGAWVAGELTMTAWITTTFAGLVAIFLRDGIAKVPPA